MSFEDIIVRVQSKPALWNVSNPIFKKKAMHKRIWQAMARELNMEETVLKKRWKHLKDQYRKELKKSNVENSTYVSGWQHYDALSFLKEELLSKDRPRNTTQSETESLGNSDDGEDTFEVKRTKKATKDETDDTQDSRKLNTIIKKLNATKQLIDTKLTAIEDGPRNDPDYMFLMSVLPSIKQLTDIQKLHFRGKVNEWLLETIMQNEYSKQGDFQNPFENKMFVQNQIGSNVERED
ncbi:uncharacterized protein ACR2FA_004669 [Aphomia sociella]